MHEVAAELQSVPIRPSSICDNDATSSIVALAQSLQQTIAAQFPEVKISTLGQAIAQMLKVGAGIVDPTMLKDLKRLKDAAAFLRHLCFGWQNVVQARVSSYFGENVHGFKEPPESLPQPTVAQDAFDTVGETIDQSLPSRLPLL